MAAIAAKVTPFLPDHAWRTAARTEIRRRQQARNAFILLTSAIRNVCKGRPRLEANRSLKSDMREMLFNNIADGRKKARHVFAVHPRPASRIENRLQFPDDEGYVAPPAENRADHAGQSHGPGIVLQIFRVYENLERAALIQIKRVVDRHIDGVIGARPFELVRKT